MTCPGCHTDNAPGADHCERCGHPLTPTLEVRGGMILAGRYEVKELLGRGGMGSVHLAHDRLLDERVALKVLRQEFEQAPEVAQRFIQEIKLARAVSHRNVCRIHEYGEDRGVRYISMAYVEGVELRAILREGGALPAREALDFTIAVAEGLHAIHEENIVHRDLKPANIMVDKKGVVRLMDFGIAKASGTDAMTTSGSIIGTPEYMSPEQIRGGPLDRRSDIYSLGVVLYELLTGAVPFRGDTPVATILRHLQDPLPLDALALVHQSEPVRHILRKALAKDPGARYATALELAHALDAARRRLTLEPTLDRDQATREIPLAERPAWRTATPLPGPAPAVVRPREASRLWALPFAAGLAAVILATALWRRPAPPAASPAPPLAAAATRVPAPSSLKAAPATTIPTAVPSASAASPPVARRRAPTPKPRQDTPVTQPAASQRPVVEQRVAIVLSAAEAALLAQQYERAMELYDQALSLEPDNETARRGRATALDARVRAQLAASSAPPQGVRLLPGSTTATSPETRNAKAFDEGFEPEPKGDVTRATQAPVLPGRIEFDVQPERLLSGEPYTLRILLRNTGRAPIEVADMLVTTTVNGRRVAGPVAPLTRQVGPGQRAPLLELADTWGDNVRSWALEATIRTSREETYKNTLTVEPRPKGL